MNCVPFGAALTKIAKLPEKSERSLDDPFPEKTKPWGLYLFILALIIVSIWIRVDHNKKGHYFWQKAPVEAGVDAAAAGFDTNAILAEAEAPMPAQ